MRYEVREGYLLRGQPLLDVSAFLTPHPSTSPACQWLVRDSTSNLGNKEVEVNGNKFPGVLWLLPIHFGIVGGVIAALIAVTVYESSWWELYLAGMLISVLYAVLIVLYFMGGFESLSSLFGIL